MKKILSLLFVLVLLSMPMAAATYFKCPEGSIYAGENNPIAYADAVVYTSGTVSNANNALGVDDNSYAYIYSTNPDSFIVLDMGEPIYDRFGLDLKVYNDRSREYWVKVYVSNDPNSGWKYVGASNGRGDDHFAIGFTGYDSITYVKLVNTDRNSRAEIDAVRGFCIADHGEEVPEFGTIAAIGVLGVAGLFIYKRRKQD